MNCSSREIPTPLGILDFSISTGRVITEEDSLAVDIFDIEAQLPPKMTVLSSTAVYFEITPQKELNDLIIQFVFRDSNLKGSPETGEALDAQSWEDSQHIVMIGTEDIDFLNSRLPSLNLSEDNPPTEFLYNGFRITLPKLAALTPISLHFIVATNPMPEPTECSTWFAVDIPHSKVAKQKRDNKAQ